MDFDNERFFFGENMTKQLIPFIYKTHSRSKWLQLANELSKRIVNSDATTAFERIKNGEFNGTPFAAELSQLMFLASEQTLE